MNVSGSSLPGSVLLLTVAGRPTALRPAAGCSPGFPLPADCRLRAGVLWAEAPTRPGRGQGSSALPPLAHGLEHQCARDPALTGGDGGARRGKEAQSPRGCGTLSHPEKNTLTLV